MNRHLDFFEPTIAASIETPLAAAYVRGARKALLVGSGVGREKLHKLLQKSGFSWIDKQFAAFQAADIADGDLVVISDGTGAEVSQALHACIGSPVAVIAPVTDHHSTKRTVFLMSIPKAGTHMLIRLFALMGLDRSSDRDPQPGTWSTPVGYEYHAPCRELLANDWFDPVGRQLLFRSPAIFVYRNPLDIVVSELDWFVKDENAFSGYLNCCADDGERLSRLIADDTVMGSIRDRINRYSGWINFGNVIPLSYEELVGSHGGGSDTQQSDSIWALQLKLQVAGSPEAFGSQLYDPGSATFSKGKIGRHLERFQSEHFSLLESLPQDFMKVLGYTTSSPLSSKITEFVHRPLVVKCLSTTLLYTPRLVRENFLGWNIVELAGRYFPVRQGEQIASPIQAQTFSGEHEGFITLTDALAAILHRNVSECIPTVLPPTMGTTLQVEGFFGFNIVRHNEYWYGFDQALGSFSIDSLDSLSIELLCKRKQCVTGEGIADVKAEILNLVVQERLVSIKVPSELFDAHDFESDQRMGDLRAHIDAVQHRTDTVLNSVQEQLAEIKQQTELIDAHDLESDQQIASLTAHIDATQFRTATVLNSVQEQLGRVFNNPFVRIGNLMHRLFIREKQKR